MARFALMGALLSASTAGLAITIAERSRGRLMRAPDGHSSWPAWFYGPNNQSDTFSSPEEVPAGWVDHPSLVPPEKVITPARTGSAPAAAPATVTGGGSTSRAQTGAGSAAPGDQSNTLDAAGWPWDADLHSATKSMTKAGLWRMKVGVERPASKEGYPKPVLDL
jgi:hypothetical protein